MIPPAHRNYFEKRFMKPTSNPKNGLRKFGRTLFLNIDTDTPGFDVVARGLDDVSARETTSDAFDDVDSARESRRLDF